MDSTSASPEPLQTVQLGPMSVRVSVRSVDPAKRTAELIMSTGSRVLRYGWDGPFYEELSLDKKAVRMGRLNNGAPLLNSHNGFDLDEVIGVVEKASLDSGKQITGIVRFAKEEDDPKAGRAFRKVQDGIIRNVSIGYRVHRLEKVEESDSKIPVFRATDWEPYEASLVAMGADDGAKVRADALEKNDCVVVTRSLKEISMAEDETPSQTVVERTTALDPPNPPPPAPEANDRDLGAAQERDRIMGITSACRAARLPVSFAERLIKDKKQLVDAQREIFDELSKRDIDAPRSVARSRVEVTGEDPFVHIRRGIENALCHRVAPEFFKLEEVGQQYRGMTLLDVGRTYLQALGIRTTGLSKMELAGLSLGLQSRAGMHTTSDFALLLADVTAKTLRRAYEEAPATWLPLARQVTMPDFKPIKRLQIGEAPQLLEVLEHGEFKHGTIGEGKEQFQLATYGRIFAITRKALVNDDTDAFSRIATLFGRAARTLESDLIWAQITANAAMGDGVALFHATHNNLAGAGTAIDITSIGAGRSAMRLQKGLDGVTMLNVAPKFLIVPAAKETLADQFVSQNMAASEAGKVNPFSGRLAVIAEPRLDANSATAWYLSSDPGQIDIIEYGTLEGEAGPMVESRVGFDVDGLEVKARHDFAAKVIDHRGLYKNPGA